MDNYKRPGIELLYKTVGQWIEVADKKATILLSIALVLFSLSITILPRAWEIFTNQMNQESNYVFGFIYSLFFIAYLTSVILGLNRLIFVIKPRLRIKDNKSSLLYFHDIQKMEITKFKNDFLSLSEEQYLENLLDQIHCNSIVASNKFKYLTTAVNFLIVAGIVAIIFVICTYLLPL